MQIHPPSCTHARKRKVVMLLTCARGGVWPKGEVR